MGHTLGLWNVMSPLCNSYCSSIFPCNTSTICHGIWDSNSCTPHIFSHNTFIISFSSLLFSAQKTTPPVQKAPEQITTSLHQRRLQVTREHHGRWWKGEGTCQDTQIEEEFEAQNQAASASLCQGSDFGPLQLQNTSSTKLVGVKGKLFCVVCARFWPFFVMFFLVVSCVSRGVVFLFVQVLEHIWTWKKVVSFGTGDFQCDLKHPKKLCKF